MNIRSFINDAVTQIPTVGTTVLITIFIYSKDLF